MANVLISGGTGLIGQKLAIKLMQNMHQVYILTHKQNPKLPNGAKAIYWSPEKREIDIPATFEIDTIVHLAGSNIAKGRWTIEKKNELLRSRVETGKFLFDTFKHHPSLRTFISASAIGYYGNIPHHLSANETTPPGNGFIPELCQNWEKIATLFAQENIRTTTIRIGIVLAKEGGALPAMMKPIKMGFGAAIGSGKQMVSWIHINDLIDIFYAAITDVKYEGVYNGVAPKPVSNLILSKKIAINLNRILLPFNVPKSLLNLILGEKAHLITGGAQIKSTRLSKNNFRFNYETIDHALINLLSNVKPNL